LANIPEFTSDLRHIAAANIFAYISLAAGAAIPDWRGFFTM
jgi:hypothetical protein